MQAKTNKRGRQLTRVVEFEERTAAEVAEEFYTYNRVKKLADATQKQYIQYIGNFIKWYGEENCIADLTASVLDKYIDKKTREGLKDISVASAMKHIRAFVKFAVKRNYMMDIEVTIPKFEFEQKDPYTEDEMELLLKKPRSDNWVEYRSWVMVNYFFATGQRLSSVLNIKVEHLDLSGCRVYLEHNKDKIKKWMPLSTATVKLLREYIEMSDLQEQDYLFPEYEGGQLKARSAEDAIADYNRKRGVEKTSIHLFRHTFAKHYIINGGNALMLQKLLNHKSLDMTMRYVNLYSQDIASELDVFNPLDTFKRNNYSPIKRKKIS